MRLTMSADCTGEPPGELIASATAFKPLGRKARSIMPARPRDVSPRRSGPAWPMMPDRRRTVTTGGERNGNMGGNGRTVAARQ